jgi:hypothetical protein
MTTPKKSFTERRIDHERRLKYAVKKAHDRLFDILQPKTDESAELARKQLQQLLP